jgi:hypothetical protein
MTNGIEDISASDLGHKLVVALRSVSDPQAVMQGIADRAFLTLRNELLVKIESMDKATNLWHDDLVRVPTEVQKSVAALKEVMEQYILRSVSDLRGEVGREIEKSEGNVGTLRLVSDERFQSIQTQFVLLKQATEQLDLANKTAIAAALQAQKESAGETQKSSQAAIAKAENSTSDAIKSLTTTFNVAIQGLTDRYMDLKSRIDRGEGKTSFSDPDTTAKLGQIMTQLAAVTARNDEGHGRATGMKDYTATMIAVVAAAVAGIALMAPHLGTH